MFDDPIGYLVAPTVRHIARRGRRSHARSRQLLPSLLLAFPRKRPVAPSQRLREVGDTEEGRRSPAAAQKPHDFWRQHWERAPGVFRGADGIRRELHGVMSWPRFLDVLEKREGRGECLHMPLDAQASSYVDETKTVLGLDDDGTAVLERGVAEELWDQAGATIQVCTSEQAIS